MRYIEKTVSVLFLDYVAARKKNIFATQIKERREVISRLRARRGLRALDLRKLLKKFDQNFSSIVVRVVFTR